MTTTKGTKSTPIPTAPEETPPEDRATELQIALCKLETIEHIENVRAELRFFSDKLTSRGVKHDRPKLESPEVEMIAIAKKKLSELEYGSEEYERQRKEMNETWLNDHYAKSRHHPEHFPNGINDMTLVDIVEMLCDWVASAKRNKNGNLLKSIKTNAERFHIDAQLEQILENTVKYMEESNV